MTERKAAEAERSAADPAVRPAQRSAHGSSAQSAPAVPLAGFAGRVGERAAFALQRLAGNRAVAASLSEIGRVAAAGRAVAVVGKPTSKAAAAPDGAEQILSTEGAFRAAGVTTLPAPGAPDLVVGSPTQQGGQWRASIQPASVTPDRATSLYPGPGVHHMSPDAVGQARHRDVTPAASDEIKDGEEEHLLDLEWARHFAYDTTADTINTVAAGPPSTGATAEQAREAACQAVRSALPAQARWPDGTEPITHWRRLYGQLVSVTRERDTPKRWHSISTEIVMDPAEKRRLNLPVADGLYRYVAGSTQVGAHPSEAQVRARYDSLGGTAAPTGGATTGGGSGTGGGAATGGGSSTGGAGTGSGTTAPPTSSAREAPRE